MILKIIFITFMLIFLLIGGGIYLLVSDTDFPGKEAAIAMLEEKKGEAEESMIDSIKEALISEAKESLTGKFYEKGKNLDKLDCGPCLALGENYGWSSQGDGNCFESCDVYCENPEHDEHSCFKNGNCADPSCSCKNRECKLISQ